MSDPDEPDVDVPQHLAGGVWANDVEVYGDLEELALDVVRRDPRHPAAGILVARVVASRWCILKLRHPLDSRIV